MTRIFLLATLLAALTLSGCSKVTLQNYDKLELGMAYEEATQILGAPDSCDEILGIKNCRWGKEDAGHVNISFADDKILLKTAQGLK